MNNPSILSVTTKKQQSRGQGSGMTTISTTYGYGMHIKEKRNGDNELRSIVQDIQLYLKKSDKKRFFLTITVKYHKRCCKSWAKIGFYLQKFLIDPKANYSMLMFILEQELDKFPKRSYYGQKLQVLFQLLEAGPVFTQKPHFYL